MKEKLALEDTEKMLKLFFNVGVTPEFAENDKDFHSLKGELKLF